VIGEGIISSHDSPNQHQQQILSPPSSLARSFSHPTILPSSDENQQQSPSHNNLPPSSHNQPSSSNSSSHGG